jgi:hypothetical protein
MVSVDRSWMLTLLSITSLWRVALSTLPHCLLVRFDGNCIEWIVGELCLASGGLWTLTSKTNHNSFEFCSFVFFLYLE